MRSFIITALLANIACATPHPRSKTKITAQTHYDYIVVGGGAGGLTVANRLSEQPNTTVLVIEAGDFDKNEDFVTIPGLAGGAVGTKYDWNITYAPSESVNGRNVSIPLGKVVGGSTKLNRMVFDRGSKSDYDRWAALGNFGWDWKSLLPYFKKVFTVNAAWSSREILNLMLIETRMKSSRPHRKTSLLNTTLLMKKDITDRVATCTPLMPPSFGH